MQLLGAISSLWCCCRIGPDAVQQAAILALGHCRQECVSMLLEEVQSLGEDSVDRAKVG